MRLHQVAIKLGKPASRVRLYCTGSTSCFTTSSMVSSRDGACSFVSSSSGASSIAALGGGGSSGNLCNMAVVEGGSIAIRCFQHFWSMVSFLVVKSSWLEAFVRWEFHKFHTQVSRYETARNSWWRWGGTVDIEEENDLRYFKWFDIEEENYLRFFKWFDPSEWIGSKDKSNWDVCVKHSNICSIMYGKCLYIY